MVNPIPNKQLYERNKIRCKKIFSHKHKLVNGNRKNREVGDIGLCITLVPKVL